VLVSCAPSVSAAERPLAVGASAPDITLVDQHGRAFGLAEVLAERRFVVLAFYVKAFTGG
jgi:peroxiredoxin